MHISVDHESTHWVPDADQYQVTLDGAPLRRCVEACEEEGWVLVHEQGGLILHRGVVALIRRIEE